MLCKTLCGILLTWPMRTNWGAHYLQTWAQARLHGHSACYRGLSNAELRVPSLLLPSLDPLCPRVSHRGTCSLCPRIALGICRGCSYPLSLSVFPHLNSPKSFTYSSIIQFQGHPPHARHTPGHKTQECLVQPRVRKKTHPLPSRHFSTSSAA